jgi:hypothetical protein
MIGYLFVVQMPNQRDKERIPYFLDRLIASRRMVIT